uniref:TxLP3 n=1 Tax=Lychas mucronatus TaxID=172552 RepID=A0A0U1S7U1_LYCMC|nr:TxLP3 [Lychas mucronatus]
MIVPLLVVALAVSVYGESNDLCDSSESQRQKFISCMRENYHPFDYALTCSQYLNIRAMEEFVDLSCGKIVPSSEEKAKYSECLNQNIEARNALSEYDLGNLLKKCTNEAIAG